jgi:hypothetical protein
MSESTLESPALPTKRKRKPWHKPPRHPYDRRTLLGRRITALAETFRRRIGFEEVAADPVLAAAVERAARLTGLAEQLSALCADPAVSPDDVVRMSRLADQAVRRLHLDRHKPQPGGPTLADIMREAQP